MDLAERDAVVAKLVEALGPPVLRPPMESHFAALVRSVLYQQLAGPAAGAIHARLLEALGGDVSPKALLALAPEWQDVDLPEGSTFQELRPLAPQLDAEEAGLLAYARALSVWRARQRFCGVCGGPTRSARAGHSLVCADPECAEEYFPRLDPAIIVLVTDGERALLGRQAGWPAGRYSTLAGFVEPGESLEDAVRREVMEESGVQVLSARYDSSQPWPFPASLMVGFQALGAPGPVRLGRELEDARWFPREALRGTEIQLPPPHSISRRLIEAWLGVHP
jgi:NAD+ diphosphatase